MIKELKGEKPQIGDLIVCFDKSYLVLTCQDLTFAANRSITNWNVLTKCLYSETNTVEDAQWSNNMYSKYIDATILRNE